MNNLIEAKEIVEQLAGMYQPAQSLLSDSLFLELLSEEISEHRKVKHQYPAKVAFDIDESGLPVYCGIFESMPKEFTGMVVVLNPDVIQETRDPAVPKTDKELLAERISNFEQEIKKVSEEIKDTTLRAAMIETMNEQIRQYSDVVNRKKEQLLDKLLKNQD